MGRLQKVTGGLAAPWGPQKHESGIGETSPENRVRSVGCQKGRVTTSDQEKLKSKVLYGVRDVTMFDIEKKKAAGDARGAIDICR